MNKKIWAALALGAAILVPTSASAHRAWFKPSATVLSGEGTWVTVDAAIGNELFYFDHHAMSLDNVKILGPDGNAMDLQYANSGEYRSTFDFQLMQPGTYRISSASNGLAGGYMIDGERRRWFGTAEQLADIPAEATGLSVSESSRRIDTFVTLGAPSDTVVAPTGTGLEFEYLTHPNDLFSGETAQFRVLMSGEPISGIEVAVIPGGNRYRDDLGEVTLVSGEDGLIEFTWPEAGLYWLGAELEDDKTSIPQATARRASYTVTLEVLPQ